MRIIKILDFAGHPACHILDLIKDKDLVEILNLKDCQATYLGGYLVEIKFVSTILVEDEKVTQFIKKLEQLQYEFEQSIRQDDIAQELDDIAWATL